MEEVETAINTFKEEQRQMYAVFSLIFIYKAVVCKILILKQQLLCFTIFSIFLLTFKGLFPISPPPHIFQMHCVTHGGYKHSSPS